MEYKSLFKSRRIPSLAESLAKRCQSVTAERQEKRREFFWGAVALPEAVPTNKPDPIEKKKNLRAEMLQKWKAEKLRRLEEAKKKQKPIFKVGIVQRKATGSPVYTQSRTHIGNDFVSKQSYKKSQTSDLKEKKVGVLTRAGVRARNQTVKPAETKEVNPIMKTERKFNKFCKIDENKKKQVNSRVFKVPEVVSKLPCSSLTFPYSPKLNRKTKRLLTVEKNKVEVKATSVENEKESEEDLQKEKFPEKKETTSPVTTPKQDDFRPIHYSPFVTVRSGKKSSRKSKKKLTMDVEEHIEKEEKEFHCRIFSFRKYIDCETKRLTEMCHKWKHIHEELEELPADVEGDIDSAIGKTNLLTSDKFNQFAGLIDKCENGDPFVKVDDLQGFQDWVSIEVEKIDEEFLKLERRKCSNWMSEVPPSLPGKKQKINTAKKPPKKPVGKSNIRSHILAARKLLREGNPNGGEGLQLPTFPFEQPAKVNTPKTERTSLTEVLNPETKTKMKNESATKKFPVSREKPNSGLEIMVATQKNKFTTPVKKSPVVRDYQVFFGEDKTPNRSILKKTPKKSNSAKGHVTFKKVAENVLGGGHGLSEKYFQPVTDSEESSPMRRVLGDVGNFAAGGVRTRSKTRQLSYSGSQSPEFGYA